jgi:hypothetical protein
MMHDHRLLDIVAPRRLHSLTVEKRNMKASRYTAFLVVTAAAMIIGIVVGHALGKRNSLSEERECMLMHEAFARQAQAYYKFLNAEDSGRPEDMAKLRKDGLATLSIYIREADDFRAHGSKWAPIDRELYDKAAAYLKNHPFPQTK